MIDEQRFAEILRKLLSSIVSDAAEAIAELSDLADPEWFDRLLEDGSDKHSALIADDKRHVYLDLLTLAPESSKRAAERRLEVTRIYVNRNEECLDVDLQRWFSRLPNVEILNVDNVRVTRAGAHPKLKSFELGSTDFKDPAAFAALAASPSLTHITLWSPTLGGSPLTDLESLRPATRLEGITIVNSTLRDIRALAAMPALEYVSLQQCGAVADISALEGHPSLRAVLLYGTLVDKEAVPKGLRRICNWTRSPNIQKMLAAEPQKPSIAKQTFTKEAKATLAQVKKFLKSDELAMIDQGLSLAASSGDATIYTELLGDAYYNETRERIVVSGFKAATGTYTLLGLIATAPPSCAIAANIRRATTLRLEGPENGTDKDRPIDLLHLEAFPNLTRLNIARLGSFVKRDRPASFPALTHLSLDELRNLEDLSILSGCPNLTELHVHGIATLTTVRAIEGHTALEEINLSSLSALSSLDGISRLPRLERLHIAWCSNLKNLGVMNDLPVLSTVQFRDTRFADVSPLRGLPSLGHLRIEKNDALVSLAALSPHPKLYWLSLLETKLKSLDGFEGFPALLQLYLFRPGPITSIDPLSKTPLLRSIDIDGCPKVTSADCLVSLPLVSLTLKNTGIRETPEALATLMAKNPFA